MRFAFHTWSSAFNYELFYVKTTDDDTLETYICMHLELLSTTQSEKTF